jgi:hypothetical protein
MASALSADCTVAIIATLEPYVQPAYSAGISECTIFMSIPCDRRTNREPR